MYLRNTVVDNYLYTRRIILVYFLNTFLKVPQGQASLKSKEYSCTETFFNTNCCTEALTNPPCLEELSQIEYKAIRIRL